MRKYKHFIAIILLTILIFISYTLPRARYVGTNFINELEIPYAFKEWQGKDVSDSLNINAADTNFNFVNDARAYNYINNVGQSLLFIILDAGNFHHPKVCFTGAGYQIRELPDSLFDLSGHPLKVHTLFTIKNNQSFLSLYWIVIDKNVAHDWIEQKFKQLYYSLFNKKRIGLMVRIDIPSNESEIENASILANQFITDLSSTLKPQEAEYIFGRQ